MATKRFSIEAVFKALDEFTAPMTRMQSGVENFARKTEKSFKQANAAADAWLGGLVKAGKLAAGATIAVGGALAVAAVPGMDFEQAMADLGASYLKTRDQIAPLEKEALRLGKATKFSAIDVVKAMEEMSKAGYTEEEALKAIAGMTFAAAASGEGLVESTTAISAAMKSMGVPVEKSAEVADVLALVSTKTASSISSLAESLAKAGPAARQLNIPFNDTVKMVGLLQDVGIDAAEAGTSVSTMLTMLAKPTDKAQALMHKLGVKFQDASGNMRPVPEVLGEFAKAAKGSKGNMKQLAFFAELLGLRGQRAAINLQKMFTEVDPTTQKTKWDELTESVEGAAGTAEKMSDLRMATLTGDIDQLVETVKSFGIELYSQYSDKLRAWAQELKKWFETEGPKYLQAFGEKIEWVRTHFDQIVDILKRVGRVIWVITAAALATKAWSAALTILSATPAVLILYAIVAVLSLIVAFWPEISAFFVNLGKLVASVCGAIWDVLVATFSVLGLVLYSIFVWPVIALFKFLWNMVVASAKASWQILVDTASGYVAMFTAVWAVIGGFFRDLWNFGIVEAFHNAGWRLYNLAKAAYAMFAEAWAPIGEFFAGLWAGVVSTFESILGPVMEKIAWAVEKVKGLGSWWSDDEAEGATGAGGAPASQPQVVSPSERIAQSIEESTTTNMSELLIRDQTGRASLVGKPAPNIRINLTPSGSFY